MANRLGVLQQTISIHLQKMPKLAKLVNTDLSKGFTVSQVAEKHGWPEPKQNMKRIFSWAFLWMSIFWIRFKFYLDIHIFIILLNRKYNNR
jgi:hypothetical protein